MKHTGDILRFIEKVRGNLGMIKLDLKRSQWNLQEGEPTNFIQISLNCIHVDRDHLNILAVARITGIEPEVYGMLSAVSILYGRGAVNLPESNGTH